MRSKRFLAITGLALAATLVAAPAASAQEGDEEHSEEVEHLIHEAHELLEEQGAHHADIECIDIILEGGTVDDCRDAPNPLLPETNEIIWGSIGFLTVLLFLWKFGYPAMKAAMKDRSDRIQTDLDAAERAKAEAEAVKAEYEAKLADARTESGRIIEEARQSADQLKADQQARLNEELAQARTAAQADIDAAKGQAMAELRGEVANIAIGAAETVVGANLDREAQTRLVEDYINRVQAGTAGTGGRV
jgi:F-type H+-transporting ATPase subunit b